MLIVNVSLSTPELAIPPYVPPLQTPAEDGGLAFVPDLSSYQRLVDEFVSIGEEGSDLLLPAVLRQLAAARHADHAVLPADRLSLRLPSPARTSRCATCC